MRSRSFLYSYLCKISHDDSFKDIFKNIIRKVQSNSTSEQYKNLKGPFIRIFAC